MCRVGSFLTALSVRVLRAHETGMSFKRASSLNLYGAKGMLGTSLKIKLRRKHVEEGAEYTRLRSPSPG